MIEAALVRAASIITGTAFRVGQALQDSLSCA